MISLWVMTILSVVMNSSQANSSEDMVGPRDLHKASSDLHVAAVQVLTQDADYNQREPKTPAEVGQSLTRMINSRTKIKIKSQLNVRKSPSFVVSTRRPLMKIRIYTAKPHTIYNDQWLRFGEQNNFGSKRTLHTRIQFESKKRSTRRQSKVVIGAQNPPKHLTNIDMTEDDTMNLTRNENSLNKTRRIIAAASVIQPVTVRKENVESKVESAITKENITNANTTESAVSGNHNTTEVTINKNVNNAPDETNQREVIFPKDQNSISASTLKTNEYPTVTTTDGSSIAHTSETRSKRGANIIEEESIATTSTGFKFTGQEHIAAEFNYNNIHT